MTGWRSVLDADYITDLGAAVYALGKSDAEAETPEVQSRVIVLASRDVTSSTDEAWYMARCGVDIEIALRGVHRGGSGRDDPRESRRWKDRERARRREIRRAMLPPMRQLMHERKDPT